MNLGTLIGRGIYGVLEPRRRPELVAALERARAEEESWRKQQEERARAAEAARREEQQRMRIESLAKARVAALAAAEKRAAEPPRPVGRPPSTRVRQISGVRALLQNHPEGLSVGQIRAALGKAAPASITSALAALPVEKSGRRRHYRYRLFKNPPPQQE